MLLVENIMILHRASHLKAAHTSPLTMLAALGRPSRVAVKALLVDYTGILTYLCDVFVYVLRAELEEYLSKQPQALACLL